MEKLQAALARARQRREGEGPAPSARVGREQIAGAALAGRWAALAPIELKTRRRSNRRLVAHSGTGEATAFDVLRTKVLQLTGSNGWRRLAVTSPAPGSGK